MSEPAISITIRCRENGPLVLPMNIKVVDHLGNEFALPQGKDVIALCRCGHSERKPFCDGHHKVANFKAVEIAQKPEGA
jgi:CDGSH-type Zn-finger protein